MILQAIIITLVYAIAYGVIPMLVFRKCFSGDALTAYVHAAFMAISVQALLGTLWSILRIGHPSLEPIVWLLAILLLARVMRQGNPPACCARSSWMALALLLLMAASIRLIHPIQTAGLGQSDAYSHLQFFRDIVSVGTLRNAVYPPGYHWVAMLPAWITGIDIYLFARFGGAAFGLLLVLSTFVFLRRLGFVSGAWLAAAMVGFFPGAVLLAKTGVGMFPNQLGLAMLPMAMVGFLDYIEIRSPKNGALMLLLCAGITVCVPMMTLDLLIVLGVETIMLNWLSKKTGRSWRAIPAVVLLLALLAITAGRIAVLGKQHIMATVSLLVGQELGDPGIISIICLVIEDFIAVKRLGLGSTSLNAVCMVLGAISIGLLGMGIKSRNGVLRILGLWGTLCSVQTGLGLFQFSAYQRAGWQLLMIACFQMGVVFDFLITRSLQLAKALRVIAIASMAICAVVSIMRPPIHTLRFSSGENDLVRYLYDLRRDAEFQGNIVSRGFTGFGYQGDLVQAMIADVEGIKVYSILPGDALPPKRWKAQRTLVFIDKLAHAADASTGAFRHVNPEQAALFEQSQSTLVRVNERLVKMIAQLNAEGWSANEQTISSSLSMTDLRPPDN